MVTQERLKELFKYNPETGEFLRIKGVRKAAAGEIAGTIALNGYIIIGIDLKKYYGHRLAWLYEHGYMPTQIDHIDRDRSNNRIVNLRAASNSLNGANKQILVSKDKPFKGVRMVRSSGRYSARIKKDKVEMHIGVYETERDAARAYNRKAIELFGEYAVLNDVS